MGRSARPVLVCYFAAAWGICAANIEGTVIIKHRLTNRRVTVAANVYARGIAVPLAEDVRGADPLAYERSQVVLYVEDALPSSPVNAAMQQENRRFRPDIVVVPAGSTVSFPNLDPIFHNVFSLSKPKSFDLGNYVKGQTRKVMFPSPGIVLVNCRLHSNMSATIVVTPNNYAAVSDDDGHVLLRDVPEGTHTVVAWHKSAGFFRKRVVVDRMNTAKVTFFIPLDENGLQRVAGARR
jgi:plastocyanin